MTGAMLRPQRSSVNKLRLCPPSMAPPRRSAGGGVIPSSMSMFIDGTSVLPMGIKARDFPQLVQLGFVYVTKQNKPIPILVKCLSLFPAISTFRSHARSRHLIPLLGVIRLYDDRARQVDIILRIST